MKVLFCGFQYEYGKPELGLATIEYQNFFGTLKEMAGVQADFFPVDVHTRAYGRDRMNELLLNQVAETKPEVLFCFLFQEEIKKTTIEYITKKTSTKTLNWFADDHWRLPVYSRFWAPLFTAVITTDSQAPEKYRRLGINNVIKSQWAVNPKLFAPHPVSGEPVISFVGKNYGRRVEYLQRLRQAGLLVRGFGKGFDGGVVSSERMVEIFSSSKINLNFTESPYTTMRERMKFLVKFFVRKESGRYITNFQFSIFNFQSQIQSFLGAQRNQIKARTFEIPACGGFLLTGDADNLGDYYTIGKEIAVFRSPDDLVKTCKYYLAYSEQRQEMAKAAKERTLKEHTYEKRFREILNKMGF